MSVMTETEFPPLASLAISPSLQALLEFDEWLWTSSDSHEKPERTSTDLAQPGQYTSWRQQEVPKVSLPPSRRKKSVVTGVPVSPKIISELQSVASPRNAFSGVGELEALGEILVARAEDVLEDVMGSGDPMDPDFDPPPSPPRYFYPCSDDEEEGIDQSSASYTLEKSRCMRLPERQRSEFSDQYLPFLSEGNGGQLFSPRYFTSFGRNVGSRPKEKGDFSFFFFFTSFPTEFLLLKRRGHVLRGRGRCSCTATRILSPPPLALNRYVPAFDPTRTKQTLILCLDRVILRTVIFPVPRTTHIHLKVCILSSPISGWYGRNLMWLPHTLAFPSTIYSASSVRSLQIPPSLNPSSIQGSFIDLGSPPMSPLSDMGSLEYHSAKSTSRNNSPRSSNPHSRSASPLPKPPVPTTPKPVFNRPRSSRRSVDGGPRVEDPPTTTLSPTERAELVKKTRKLTQMFGQTPGPDLTSPSPAVNSPLQQSYLAPDVRRGHRVVTSVSNLLHPSDRGVWPPPEETLYLNINGRRHSTPLSPTTVSTMWGSDEDGSVFDPDQRSFYSNKPSRVRLSRKEKSSSIVSTVPSPMSFIDLSDDESAAEPPKDITNHRHQTPESPTDDTASLLTLTSSQVHEEERRWKREKLVKLHRYLGSRVPTDLVLGLDLSQSPPLPPPAFPDMEPEDTRKKFRMRRRRSSSCAEYTRTLTAREDRMKSDLDMQEKALNVRRAAKMEKVGTPDIPLYFC